MGLLNIIRKLRLRQGLPIREISRRTGLSRNTIKKYLRAGTIEPVFSTPDRSSKLDPFAEKLAGWLKAEAGKSRKQRQTLKQMHADLVTLGFTGSYSRVAAFAREWRADRHCEQQTTGRGTFVPLSFSPGEAFQFDWSEDFAVLAGERTKLQVAHIKLSHSRAFLLRAYARSSSTAQVLKELHARGIRTKRGTVFDRGYLLKFLHNKVYLGLAVHKDEVYPGEHKAIIDQKLWDEVHDVIANNPVARGAVARAAQPALLRGLIFTETGAAMTPHHTKRKGKRYCYYTSMDVIRKRPAAELRGPQRLPGAMVEEAVIGEIRRMLRTPEVAARTARAVRKNRPDLDESTVVAALAQFDKLSRMFRVSRPMDVVVLKDWVARPLQEPGRVSRTPS